MYGIIGTYGNKLSEKEAWVASVDEIFQTLVAAANITCNIGKKYDEDGYHKEADILYGVYTSLLVLLNYMIDSKEEFE